MIGEHSLQQSNIPSGSSTAATATSPTSIQSGMGSVGPGHRNSSSLLTIVKAQIVFLLSTLTEENFERNQVDIRTLSEQHGIETYLHFIRRLIAASQSRLSSTATPSAYDTSSSLAFRLLVQEIQRLARDPFLADRFRDGIDKGEGDIFRHFDLVRFADRIGLRPLERLVLASSIVSTSTRRELATQANNIIRVEFDNAILSLYQHPSFDHADLTISQVAKLLSNLLSDPPADSPVLEIPQCVALVTAAQTKYGQAIMAPILQQIFPTLSLPPGTSLIETLVRLGPDITSDPDTVRALLMRFGISDASPPRDAQIIEIVSTLARLAAEGQALCDVGSLVRAISSFRSPLHWPNVIRAFDRPDRQGVDTATLKLLIAILLNAPRDIDPHPITGFWATNWANPLYQLRLLDSLLSLPNDTFNLVALPGKRIVTVDDVSSASPTIKALAANVQGHTWNSLDLVETLVRLGDHDSADVKAFVREMLDKAVKISAELIHMGLLQVPKPWNSTQMDYATKLLSMFLAGHPNHQLVFMRIWQIDPNYLTAAFREFYAESPLNITRILDVAQDLKILEALLDVRPFVFALDVAALASRREYLNLDKWLADNVNSYGESFTHAVMDFLELKISSDLQKPEPQSEPRTMPLNASTIAIFIRVLRSSPMSAADAEYFTEIRNMSCQLFPRLMNLMPGSDSEPGIAVASFSQDVELEAETIYREMYEERIAVDQVIHLLKRYKVSNIQHEKEVFAFALLCLFEEYKFFQQDCPDRVLAMTGYLFGSLIQHRLVEYIPLGIAIRYVLDAIRNPPNTNLFRFGVQALSRFESRLPEWPQLCQALLSIPHLQEARPDLTETARRALTHANDPATQNGTDLAPPSEPDPGLSVPSPTFLAIQPDVIPEGEGTTEPDEETVGRILFLINNLAPSNFDEKLVEMKEKFQDDYSKWLGNYLVDQRVSTEPNNHGLYMKLLDSLASKLLFKFVLNETFIKSARLLNSEKTLQSSTERAVLKNLGAWLGALTVAGNKPIMHKNIAFKDLLVQGYDSNRLIVAIPFVCKILEQCSKSRIFKPPNPWLMAVVSLLAELYHFAELKLNLKFEIEVLCKGLEIDLDKVEATSVLRSRPPADPPQDQPSLPDFSQDVESLPVASYESTIPPQQMGDQASLPHVAQQQVLQIGSGSPGQNQQAIGLQLESIISNIPNLLTISPQLAHIAANPGFKRIIQVAVERAVREIILPVVERSVTIAGISTRELVAKDFALEGDEVKMRKAAHSMAQNLAGSLALVTCKEPLRSNMMTHLRNLFTENGYNEHLIPEQVILILVGDNIDIACSVIERAAMERAIADVDEGFASSYNTRRRHREQRPGQPFWDINTSPSQFAATLPDLLRIKPNGLQYQQTRVYDDFGPDAKRYVSARPGSTTGFPRTEPMLPVSYPSSSPAPDQDFGLAHRTQVTHQQVMEEFTRLVPELERAIAQAPAQSVSALPVQHEILLLVRQILHIGAQSPTQDDTLFSFSQKVVQLLFKTSSQLGRDIYVLLLERLCEMSTKVSKEAIEWLIYAEDDRKFNVPVTMTLIRAGLVGIPDYDLQLAKLIVRDFRPAIVDFAASLIAECSLGEGAPAPRNAFAYSLEALGGAVQAGKATEQATKVLEEFQGRRQAPGKHTVGNDQSDNPMMQIYDQLAFYFGDWVRLFQRSRAPEKGFANYVMQLSQQGILKGEEVTLFFFRVCIETSIEMYNKHIAAGDYVNAFQPIDALSKLIVLLVKYNGDAGAAKVHYLSKVVSIVTLVIAHAHEEQGADFQQKPFFRFFSTLFSDLQTLETTLQSSYFQLLVSLCDSFNTLQPMYFPGFAFSWMSLISHRLFMPRLLQSENREGWAPFHRLLISLFRFQAPFLRKVDMQPASRNLFQGTLRLLLVLLHDWPEFLCEYYFTICDAIPPSCIQLRNVVLSAYPPNLTLPDPFTVDLEKLVDMGPIPPVLSDFTSMLAAGDLRGSLDQYLFNRGSASLINTLKDVLATGRQSKQSESESERYNLGLVNALVTYIGVSSVAQAKARSGSSLFVPTDPGVGLLLRLAIDLDIEGQHHLLSAIVLHLRFPNAHTHWFSSLILHLFLEVKTDRFQEIVTKVLLERFVVHRPHPWGAMVTFIELLRNAKYGFWARDFGRIAPEISLLLDPISRSIPQTAAV